MNTKDILEKEKKEKYHKSGVDELGRPQLEPCELLEIENRNGWNSAIDHLIPIVEKLVERAKQDIDDKYNELLFAVETKHKGETRHETALRYIMEAENADAECSQVTNPK